jgi:hypothetical protein
MLRREKVKRHALLLSFLMIIFTLPRCAVRYETATNPAGVSATTYEGRVLTDVGIWSQLVTMYDSFTKTLFQSPMPTSTPQASTAPPVPGGGGSSAPTEEPPIIEPQPAVPETPTIENNGEVSLPTYQYTGKEVAILWKPVSESNGKLVVLLANTFDNVPVSIGTERGKMNSDNPRSNGNRPTYRFSKPGKDYPDPSILQAGDRKFLVTSPAKRHEKLKEIK